MPLNLISTPLPFSCCYLHLFHGLYLSYKVTFHVSFLCLLSHFFLKVLFFFIHDIFSCLSFSTLTFIPYIFHAPSPLIHISIRTPVLFHSSFRFPHPFPTLPNIFPNLNILTCIRFLPPFPFPYFTPFPFPTFNPPFPSPFRLFPLLVSSPLLSSLLGLAAVFLFCFYSITFHTGPIEFNNINMAPTGACLHASGGNRKQQKKRRKK